MISTLTKFFQKYPHQEDHILERERDEPSEWWKPLIEQIDELEHKYLIGIEIDKDYLNAKLSETPPDGYKRIAVPKLSYLAKKLKIDNPYVQIGDLIEHVCELLQTQRNGLFTHYRKGQLGTDRIQSIQKIVDIRKNIESKVPGDVLILDVDMGNKYAGWTTRRAREDILYFKKFLPLSAVDVLWTILLNPDRLQKNTDLSIDSVAEEYKSEDRGWVTTLFYYHRGGKLEFGYRWNRRAYFDCGTAIAILNNKTKLP